MAGTFGEPLLWQTSNLAGKPLLEPQYMSSPIQSFRYQPLAPTEALTWTTRPRWAQTEYWGLGPNRLIAASHVIQTSAAILPLFTISVTALAPAARLSSLVALSAATSYQITSSPTPLSSSRRTTTE